MNSELAAWAKQAAPYMMSATPGVWQAWLAAHPMPAIQHVVPPPDPSLGPQPSPEQLAYEENVLINNPGILQPCAINQHPVQDQDHDPEAIPANFPVGSVINVHRSDLLPVDPVYSRPYTEGQSVIRILGQSDWVFDGSLMNFWNKHGRKTNPLVSGFNGPIVPDDQIQYGTLHIIEPTGGKSRRRKTRRRRAQKTRRSRK
jgi:hypothetical protein